MQLFRNLPRTVVLLGTVSFFNDLSSEMIYPLLPVFLSTVLGAGAMQLGIIEGLAETTASFLKVASGIWTDRLQRRKPFILAGYFTAGFSRSLMGLARAWPWVALFRFFDRLGKGVRTSPRDALIADITPGHQRGAAYGLHRAMDHAGAAVGPLVAAFLLSSHQWTIRQVFYAAAIPSFIAISLLFFLDKETKMPPPEAAGKQSFSWGAWNQLPSKFKIFLVAVFLFELGGSTDAFLLLRLTERGLKVSQIAILWSLLHIIKMGATYFAGPLADRYDRRKLLVMGWCLYAVIYALIGTVNHPALVAGLFLLYGLYFGLTEPTERAWISEVTTKELRGTAFGYYHGVVGLAALPAGILFGYLWSHYSPSSAFYVAAALSLAAAALLSQLSARQS